MTVDPKTATYDPSKLKDYMTELGVPYFYEEQSKLAEEKKTVMIDTTCSKHISNCRYPTNGSRLTVRMCVNMQLLQPHEA